MEDYGSGEGSFQEKHVLPQRLPLPCGDAPKQSCFPAQASPVAILSLVRPTSIYARTMQVSIIFFVVLVGGNCFVGSNLAEICILMMFSQRSPWGRRSDRHRHLPERQEVLPSLHDIW